jgi:uncharacterized membrane protein SpoIIM required for sporulation
MDTTGAGERAAPRELALRSAGFRRAREAGWRKLDDMIARAERGGIGALSASETLELPSLYRSAVSSLSVARGIALDRGLLLYLENLTLRAYLVVYGPRTGVLRSVTEFFARGWPRSVRALRRHLLAIALVFAAGALAGFMMVREDINNFNLFVPEETAQYRGPASTRRELLEDELFPPWPGFAEMFVSFANALFRHNSKVGLMCFGLGFMLGVPTILLTARNGAALGAFAALHADKGLAVDFAGWLSIHGVTEILAILLMSAAGLSVAEKILFPGTLTRLENLRRGGRDITNAAAGGVVMLFAAGIIEGGFRQLIASTPGRYAFAAATAAWWAWYFAGAGRSGYGGAD